MDIFPKLVAVVQTLNPYKVNNKQLLIGGGIAVGAYLLFKAVKYGYSATRLQFYINKYGIQFDGINPVIVIDVMGQNPTDQDYNVSSLVGQLYINGSQVGNIGYYTATRIAPNSQTKFVLPVRVSLLGAAAQLVAASQAGLNNVKADMRIVGTANVDNIPLPFDLTYSMI